MGRRRTPGLWQDANGYWHIDKVVLKKRIRGSTGTRILEEAEEILEQEIAKARRAKLLGERPRRIWREAATEHLIRNSHLSSIDDDALHLKQLDPFIGDLPLREVHIGSLQRFIRHRLDVDKVKTTTVNRALEVVRKILNQAAGEWLDDNGLTWLESAPKIKLLPVRDARKAYTLSWAEQANFFSRLPRHLGRMALFKVNTGTREQEVCQLRWTWERWVPELKCSVFLIPAWVNEGDELTGLVKNREDRLVVCNSIAQSVINECRGEHPEFVFTYEGKGKLERGPLTAMNNTGWQNARKAAGLPVRVHDLKHTFGRRLRAAGVPHETRKVLLGHKDGDITAHYSVAEIAELKEAVDRLVEATERKVTLLRVVA